MGIFACSLCAEPWGEGVASAWVPVKNCFFVSYSPAGLGDANPFGFQIPWVEALKVGAQDVCFKPFTPQGEAES